MTRLFISTEKQVDIDSLCDILNSFFQDSEFSCPVIEEIKYTRIINIWGLAVFEAEINCGSDALDELLEHIQKSGSWFIEIAKNNRAEIWEVDEGLGSYYKTYEEERPLHRKKLMRNWAKQKPMEEERPAIVFSEKEEAEYQERLRLMKITSAGGFTASVPEHFTEYTTQFLYNLATKARPPVYKKLDKELAYIWINSYGSCTFCGTSLAETFYREALQQQIVKAALQILE